MSINSEAEILQMTVLSQGDSQEKERIDTERKNLMQRFFQYSVEVENERKRQEEEKKA
jgi:hypothetical protein